MPGKEKRVAARQAQLRQKKRKGERHSVRSLSASSTPTSEHTEMETFPERKSTSNKPTTPLTDSSTQLSQIRPYVSRELRRISLLSAVMIIALASITILSRV